MKRQEELLRAVVVAGLLCLWSGDAQALWPVFGGGVGSDGATEVVTDDAGNVYVLGEFSGIAFSELSAEGLTDFFVAKYAPDGELEWIRSAGGPSFDRAQGIAVDDSGNVYVTGYFWGSIRFFNEPSSGFGILELPATGNTDDPDRRELLVAKLDVDGNWEWAVQAGGAGHDEGFDVAIIPGVQDPDNPIEDGVVVSGRVGCPEFFTAATGLGGGSDEGERTTLGVEGPMSDGTFPVCGQSSILVARLDNAGNWIWAKHGGSDDSRQWATEITVDPLGRVFVGGVFLDDTVIATPFPTTLTHVGPPGGGSLEFWHSYDTQVGGAGRGRDGGALEYTTDGGNWYDILAGDGDNDPTTNEAEILEVDASQADDYGRFDAQGYTRSLNWTRENPLLDNLSVHPSGFPETYRQVWAGDSSGFARTVVDLADFSGLSIKFRWRFGSDNDGTSDVGWWVDDVTITDGDGTVLFTDDMESAGTWSISAPESYAGEQWDRTTSDAHAGSWSWFVPDVGGVSDHRLTMSSSVAIPEAAANYFVAKLTDTDTPAPSWQWVTALPAEEEPAASGTYRIVELADLVAGNPECSDGLDNDGDGDFDYGEDSDCVDDEGEADPDALSESGVGAGSTRLLVAGSVNMDGASLGGTQTLADAGAFLAELLDGASPSWQWAHSADGGEGHGVAQDLDGGVYLAGHYTGAAVFSEVQVTPEDTTTQTLTLESSTEDNVFVARANPSGTAWTWVATTEPSDSGARAFSVAAHGINEVYLAGDFRGAVTFGDREIEASGDRDAYAANLDQDDGEWFQVDFQSWIVGQEVPAPDLPADQICLDDDQTSLPEIVMDVTGTVTDYFFWSQPSANQDVAGCVGPCDGNGHLYAVQPVSATIKWKASCDIENLDRELTTGASDWPKDEFGAVRYCSSQEVMDDPTLPCAQLHVAGAPADIEPVTSTLRIVQHVNMFDAEASTDGAVTVSVYPDSIFNAGVPGFSVLLYSTDPDSQDLTVNPVVIEVVHTVDYDTNETIDSSPVFTDSVACTIGQEIEGDAFGHDEHGDKNGYVLLEDAYYDGAGSDRAYIRDTRGGQIIPVNQVPSAGPASRDPMAVAWYRKNTKTVAWPTLSARYDCQWPASPDKIIVASQLGTEVLGQEPFDPLVFEQLRIYVQGDVSEPGFNPNDEHAFEAPANAEDGGNNSGFSAVFALRDDFTAAEKTQTSDPYVLVKYKEAGSDDWSFRVYQVFDTGASYTGFQFSGSAGNPVFAPYPVRLLGNCEESAAYGQPAFKDYKEQVYAKAAGTMIAEYYYPLQPGFHWDLDGDGTQDQEVTECVPWLGALTDGDPIDVRYDIEWPPDVPVLLVGETLLSSKRGLPEILNQAAVEIVFDELEEQLLVLESYEPDKRLAQIIDPTTPRSVFLDEIPADIATSTDPETGKIIPTGSADGTIKLPSHIRSRVEYDFLNTLLAFKGEVDETGTGDPLVLLNVMSGVERQRLKQLDGGDGTEEEDSEETCLDVDDGCTWDQAVEALYRLSRNPNQLDLLDPDTCTVESQSKFGGQVNIPLITCTGEPDGEIDDGLLVGFQDLLTLEYDAEGFPEFSDGADGLADPQQVVGFPPALTAGFASGTGYVTLAFNNDASLTPLPVTLEVIRVDCLEYQDDAGDTVASTYQGQLQIIESDNVFDEQLTLRHSGDFGGNPDGFEFEWYFHPDEDGTPPQPPPDPDNGQLNGWLLFTDVDDDVGAIDITIEGANLQTLSDNWYLARYRYVNAPTDPITSADVCGGDWSLFGGQPGVLPPDEKGQLAEGWIKRVVTGLNPFEARVQDFHAAATNTYASMLVQLGERWEGNIAFNPDAGNLNSIGLIEAYQTVLNRGMSLSVDGTPPVSYAPANAALLLVASRIADFYSLLANEAYADGQDPMIGFGTDSGVYGTLAPTIFAFQNQLDSLLEEELVLFRGRDDSQGPVAARPVYNRLFWNFTSGDGEFAYQQGYNITDQDLDGLIDETDARILFPQGHGDAWGHYLTGMKVYYGLLRHDFYTWEPRPEAVIVAGTPIQVDFLDERKFATLAAAKARAGAEIVDLTYRLSYVEDAAGQWQGYKDTDSDRAWGLSGWGRRAGQGAYFDWVVANSLLPEEDPDPTHTGIQQIDRQRVTELEQIVARYDDIQAQLDEADQGLNPLGLAKGVVTFDINPQLVFDPVFGKTHFEQVYDRAEAAMDNAVATFNHANQLSELLRRTQDTVDDLTINVTGQERDFKSRLIEVFGYPYAADIGPGGTYPSGYDGPDVYHYMYVDSTDLTGTRDSPTQVITATFGAMPTGVDFFNFTPRDDNCENPDADNCSLGNNPNPDDTLDVDYHVTTRRRTDSADMDVTADAFFLIKPESFENSNRRAPGELQDRLSDLLVALNDYEQILEEYDNLIDSIESQADFLETQYDVSKKKIKILSSQRGEIYDFNVTIGVMKATQLALNRTSKLVKIAFEDGSACIPTNTVLGLASGGDLLAGARCALKFGKNVASAPLDIASDAANLVENSFDLAKEDVALQASLEVQILDENLAIEAQANELQKLMREEVVVRLESFQLREIVEQNRGNYLEALAKGQRILAELIQFRRNTAADVQDYRYQDMAFRVFRNDALQKYRAQFDLVGRYAYLAAAAYDFETNLLGSDNAAGQGFLTDIVRHRSLGQILDGEPVPGSRGLADPMGRLRENFTILKAQLGFLNPQDETNRFSLRDEAFRILEDDTWRKQLENSWRVDDLWQLPEFRRFAKPFAPESDGPQPGLVIPFSTTVTSTLNFFGRDLGPGDSSYDPSNFATKVRAVGVWFGDYDGLPLSNTPRVYLMPVGADVLRSPSDSFDTRDWEVVDQVIPEPFPIGDADLQDPDWIPINDSLGGDFTTIRRFSRFRAYHDPNGFDPEETTEDSRLIGRSVWNRKWLLVIPGETFLFDAEEGLDTFIHGDVLPGSSCDPCGPDDRDGNGVTDILIFFRTYAYSGI